MLLKVDFYQTKIKRKEEESKNAAIAKIGKLPKDDSENNFKFDYHFLKNEQKEIFAYRACISKYLYVFTDILNFIIRNFKNGKEKKAQKRSEDVFPQTFNHQQLTEAFQSFLMNESKLDDIGDFFPGDYGKFLVIPGCGLAAFLLWLQKETYFQGFLHAEYTSFLKTSDFFQNLFQENKEWPERPMQIIYPLAVNFDWPLEKKWLPSAQSCGHLRTGSEGYLDAFYLSNQKSTKGEECHQFWEDHRKLAGKIGKSDLKHHWTDPNIDRFSTDGKAIKTQIQIEMERYIQLTLNRRAFQEPTARNILLSGPPGTGKTKCAIDVATSLQLPWLMVSPDRLLSQWQGKTEQNLETLWREVSAKQPCVVIFDECEHFCRDRTATHNINQNGLIQFLLQKLSTPSYPPTCGAFFILLTNIIEDVDEAITSRCVKKFRIPHPDSEMLKLVWKNKLLQQGFQFSDIELNKVVQKRVRDLRDITNIFDELPPGETFNPHDLDLKNPSCPFWKVWNQYRTKEETKIWELTKKSDHEKKFSNMLVGDLSLEEVISKIISCLYQKMNQDGESPFTTQLRSILDQSVLKHQFHIVVNNNNINNIKFENSDHNELTIQNQSQQFSNTIEKESKKRKQICASESNKPKLKKKTKRKPAVK